MNFRYETFAKSFLALETRIELEKKFRYFILNVDLDRISANLESVKSLSEGMVKTIKAVNCRLAGGGTFHVSLWKRHNDGTCNLVCYRESAINSPLPRAAQYDLVLANQLTVGKAKPSFRLEKKHATPKFRLGVVIPTSLREKLHVVKMPNSYKAYYPIIGCDCFDIVELGGSNGKSVDCYVDDNGIGNGSPVNEYWYRAYRKGLTHSPLFGVCVITMTDMRTGESTKTDLAEVKSTLRKFGFTDDELSF